MAMVDFSVPAIFICSTLWSCWCDGGVANFGQVRFFYRESMRGDGYWVSNVENIGSFDCFA